MTVSTRLEARAAATALGCAFGSAARARGSTWCDAVAAHRERIRSSRGRTHPNAISARGPHFHDRLDRSCGAPGGRV